MDNKLDEKTLELILLNKYGYEQKSSERMAARINAEMGAEIGTQSPQPDFRAKINRIMASIIAKRLMINDRSVPLIQIDDFQGIFSRRIQIGSIGEVFLWQLPKNSFCFKIDGTDSVAQLDRATAF